MSNHTAIEATETSTNYPSESLSKKVVHGVFWVFALRIASRGLGFVRTIVLARLLAPEDFGLLGLAMLAIGSLETLSTTGFQTALIQKKDDIRSYLDTAWTISAIRGIVIFLLLFFSAPLVATFFNSPQATLVIRIVAVTSLLSAMKNIGVVFFNKELEFNKQFYFEMSGTLVDIAVAITLAFIMRNVWALVWAGLAAGLMRLWMSYFLHPFRPRVRIEKEKFYELFGFGKWVLVSGILFFLITEGDDIFVGKMLGITALGLYQMAYLLSNMPTAEIAHVLSQVTFPFYSKLQNELSKLREAYLKVLQITVFISFPIGGLIFVLAPDFISICLGEKWMPMVPAMKILVLAGCIRCIATTSGLLFYAVGKPKVDTVFQLICLVVLSMLIYPFSERWGLLGIAFAVFFSIFLSNIGVCYMAIKEIKSGFACFLKSIAIPLLAVSIAVYFLLSLKSILAPGIWALIILSSLGVLIYLVASYLLDRLFGDSIYAVLKEAFNSIQDP